MNNQLTLFTAPVSSPTTIYDYLGHLIPFENKNGLLMVNATLMAKKYKERPDNYLRGKDTQKFIIALANKLEKNEMKNRVTADNQVVTESNSNIMEKVVFIKNGGTPTEQGTWFHEKLALDFARWLAPEFALWLYDTIEEVLQNGKVDVFTIPAPAIKKSIKERTSILLGNDEMAIFDEKVSKGISLLTNEKSFNEGGDASCILLNSSITRMIAGRVPAYLKVQYNEPKKSGLQILREREPANAAAITLAKAELIKGDLTVDQLQPFGKAIVQISTDLLTLRNNIALIKK